MKFVQRVAWAATVVTYFLIALGGTVLATDSGLSCPDWPLCYGQAYYSGTYRVFLEQFHRFTAATVSILIVLLLIGIIAWARKDRALLTMAIVIPVLLAIQIVLGGLTVLWKLPPQIITAHLATALAIFAIMITIAVLSSKPASAKEHPAKTRKFAQLAITNALLVYILMLLGSYVTGSGAALACPGWPLCTPASWAVSNHLAEINILHRIYAVFVGLVTLWTVISALRRWRVARGQAIVGLVGGLLFVYQAIVGGLIVLLKEPAFVAGLHLALATAVWGTLVLLAALASNQLRAAPQQQEIEEMEQAETEAKKEIGLVRQTIANYVDLMKPHVTVLLLSAVLACSGILFYVFVYTMWLKRSTVQNIVIGGAAGAVPVLVGWAAITNNLSLPAIWLFAIIFFWTPPHFWALSLLIQKDYEKAGIPMLPVVKGEAETRRQILLYSLLLLAITLVLFAMGIMGYFYLAGALILGGGLVYLAIRLWRDQSKKWARTLFWYSNMYLAAIFAIMVLDLVILQ